MFLIPTITNLNNKKLVSCNKNCTLLLPSATRTLYKFQGDMSYGSKENSFGKADGRVYLFGHTVSPVFPYEISTTGKNNNSNSLPSHLVSRWFIWIISLICGSFSDSVTGSFKPEVKRLLGRLRRRWEDNIKMDLQEVGGGCGDWMELAQYRDRWRALVSTVMNFRVR